MPKKNIYHEALEYIKYKRDIFFIFICILIGVVISSTLPIIYGILIDSLTTKSTEKFYTGLILFLSITFFSIMSNFIEEYYSQYICNKYIAYHQQHLFKKLLNISFYNKEELSNGYVIANLSSDIYTIVNSDIRIISMGTVACMNFILPIIIMIKIQIQMTIIALLFFPAILLCSFLLKESKKNVYREMAEADDEFYSSVNNGINYLLEIRGLNQEITCANKFNKVVERVKSAENKKCIIDYLISLSDNLLQNFFSIIIISMAAKHIFSGEMSIGILLSFNIYVSRLFSSISSFKEIQLAKQPLKIALDRIRYLNEQGNIDLLEIQHRKFCESICIKNLSFGYKEVCVINNLFLDVSSYGFYSIVGKNGCGKTTLLKIIDGIYRPSNGEIWIGQHSYADLNEKEIRSHITYITKNCLIIKDTFLENIRLNHGNSLEDVTNVCKEVGLLKYIDSLPNGIDAVIDPDNDNLSSGMRQRISIARVMLNPTPIILLDEITSDLDGESEKRLIANIIELGKQHIVISISHRIEAIKNSTRIFLMNEGKFTTSGTYKKLYESSQEFINLFVHE